MKKGDIKVKKFLDHINITKSYRFELVYKRIHYELYLDITNGEVAPFEKVFTKQGYYFSIPERTRRQHYKAIAKRLGKVF